MLVKVDVENKKVLHNGKIIDIDLFTAMSMAPAGTSIEVIEELDENSVVTVKIHLPKT
jgi:hypothetical protein